MQALDQLSEDHRRIIMLSDLEGLSYREIAETLEIPMGTVMSRLHNARKRLRDVLGPLLMLVLALVAGPGRAGAAAQAPARAGAPIVRFGARVLMGTDAPLPLGLARRAGRRRRAAGGVHAQAAPALPLQGVRLARALSRRGAGGHAADVARCPGTALEVCRSRLLATRCGCACA